MAVRGGARRRIATRQHYTVQWHVTARCGGDCSHCYMRDAPNYDRQLEDELGIDTCRAILKKYVEFFRRNKVPGRINFTGGDPLLKPGLIGLIRDATKCGVKVGILGNPENLDLETARRLKKAGVFRYQVSIDGTRETHDRLRGRSGSFDDALGAIDILKRVGIPSVVMFTVSSENSHELIEVIRLVASLGVSIFDFARIVPMGRASGTSGLKPEEYRRLMFSVFEEYRKLDLAGCRTYFGRKEPLWTLLYSELGMFDPGRCPAGTVNTGCSVGCRIMTVLSDGTVYPCRRLPVEIGRLPRDDIEWILRESPAHTKLREISLLEKCGRCDLLRFCRGCLGVAAATTGDPFGPDPQCWRRETELGPRDRGRYDLKDFAFWRGTARRSCGQCDEACGGCAGVCGGCSEVCASCSGCDG